MNITLNGKLTGGATKIIKKGEDKVTYFKFKYVAPIAEEDFKEFSPNAAIVAYSFIPFNFKKIPFDGFKNTVSLSITELDEDGDDEGTPQDYKDVEVASYEFINAKNLPKVGIVFLVPTSKNLVESLVKIDGNVRLSIN